MIFKDSFIPTLEEMESKNLDDLKTKKSGSLTFDFSETVEKIGKMLEGIRSIVNDENFNSLAFTLQNENAFNNLPKQLANFFKRIEDVNPEDADAKTRVNSIATDVEIFNRDTYIAVTKPINESLKIEKFGSSDYTQKIQSEYDKIRLISGEAKKEAQKIEKQTKLEAEKLIKSVKKQLGSGGSNITKDVFWVAADGYKWASWRWLLSSMMFLALVGALLLHFWNTLSDIPAELLKNESLELFLITQYSILKITTLSVALIGLYQSIKNYNTNRHLYVVNKHRHLSLSVYPLMVSSAVNENLSGIIQRYAAEAIFSHGDTGHLSSGGKGDLNALELVNKIYNSKS